MATMFMSRRDTKIRVRARMCMLEVLGLLTDVCPRGTTKKRNQIENSVEATLCRVVLDWCYFPYVGGEPQYRPQNTVSIGKP